MDGNRSWKNSGMKIERGENSCRENDLFNTMLRKKARNRHAFNWMEAISTLRIMDVPDSNFAGYRIGYHQIIGDQIRPDAGYKKQVWFWQNFVLIN